MKQFNCWDWVCGKVDDGKVKFVVGLCYSHSFQVVSCDSKVNEVNKVIGKCSKCELKQKMDRCKSNKAASVVVEDSSGKKKTLMLMIVMAM